MRSSRLVLRFLGTAALVAAAAQAQQTPPPAATSQAVSAAVPSIAPSAAPVGLTLTLEQASSRSGSDYAPVYEGKGATLRGQVSIAAMQVVDSHFLAIQDEAEYGFLLQGPDGQFNGLEPGDWVEVDGTIKRRAGLPIMLVREIRKTGHSAPPAPKNLRIQALTTFRYLGLLVTTEATIGSVGENTGGYVISLTDHGKQLEVFRPKLRRNSGRGFGGYRAGDRIRVTGIATQYCPLPPFDRDYQLLLPGLSSIVLIGKAWIIPPSLLLTALFVILALLALWSLRERHMSRQRRTMRALNTLGEQVLGLSSPAEIARKLAAVLSDLIRASGVSVLVYNRQSQVLEGFYPEGTARAYAEAQPAPGLIGEAAFAALRNRTLLSIPDTRRSPFFRARDSVLRPPRSAVFVPMLALGEPVGVVEIEYYDQVHYFTQDEQAAIQHLANQVAAALRLQEQQELREQLFCSEKLAAAGELMSGVANELRLPLESIANLIDLLRDRAPDAEPHIVALSAESERAGEIVRRLLAFSKAEQTEVSTFDLNSLIAGAVSFREQECRSKGIVLQKQLARQPLAICASQGQLEQVFLNFLVHAEQSIAPGRAKPQILITTTLLGRRALVEILWPACPADRQDKGTGSSDSRALGLDVCKGIIHSQGGDIRLTESARGDARLEVELPVAETQDRADAAEPAPAQKSKRQLTVLIVEPEANSQRHLVAFCAGMGHRVVPVASAEEAAEMAQRLHFDLTICSVRLPGLSWADFLERVRESVGGFVLLTDGYDPNLARAFKTSDVFVLSKPVDDSELRRICETLQDCGRGMQVRTA